jgi:hypothetical protein
MLTRPRAVKSIGRILQYSEQKIGIDKAELLLAENFIKDMQELGHKDKLDRFNQRISLNSLSDSKAFHISINFSTEDKVINEEMGLIAKRYMEKMGFDEQPYLAYRHYDSAHPHLHIVSTNIRPDGSQIWVSNKVLHEAIQLVKAIEIEYSLTKRKSIDPKDEENYKVTHAQRAEYGRDGLKRSISDVLHVVVEQYRYSSLTELNAILRLFNVKADRGKETSQVYQKRGLLYHLIDERGVQQGKSIKASDFLLKPTLVNLEQRFVLNESLQKENQQRVMTAIDWVMAGGQVGWTRWREELEEERIAVVVQADKKGEPEGVFFVDHETKCVFAGESLGSLYMLEAIRHRCGQESESLEESESLRQRLNLGL